ncbi:MAG: DNA-processing protein DprA [Oscillospiraceae bacterium]|nr:DNA-processing protein DprA [Oscillospiraceae bacterium]
MTEYYLWLLQLMGTANPKTLQLIQHYGSAEAVYNAISVEKETKFLSPSEIKRLGNATLDNSNRILEQCEKMKISIVTLNDDDYPYRLQNIYNPPVLLFYKGNIKGLNDEICITGVGARGATEYTAKVTSKTCRDLAKIGVVLVSGMAVGVDHLVHQSALDVGGRTIGVLACGLGVDYPRGSIPTRERIYELGGACITELFPTAETSRTYFHARNRILSGLSMGVMVFQAGNASGSLITANYAVQQGRDLFCVPPHDIFSPDYSGVVGYLRDGAIPLFNYLDVVNSYYSTFSAYSEKLRRLNEKYTITPENHFIFQRTETKPAAEKSAKASSKAKEQEDVPDVEAEKKPAGVIAAEKYHFDETDDNYRIVYEFLKENGTQLLENITSKCNISPEDISLYLLELELAGIIKALPGARYAIKE